MESNFKRETNHEKWDDDELSKCSSFALAARAEPLLTQIKADRTVVASPVFDKVNFDDLGVVKYLSAAHAFDWALWCMYESFTPEYYQHEDPSLPGK